jgi:hypothetical protein
MTFTLDSFVGSLPPVKGRQLYMARVDPRDLITGYEVVLDAMLAPLQPLEQVQLTFIRRLLGLPTRSTRHILFTETGLLPLRYRRLMLALRYMSYLVKLPPQHYANAAFWDSVDLACHGRNSWFAELHRICAALPHPVNFPLHNFANNATHAVVLVEESAHRMLADKVQNSAKVYLRRDRLEGRLKKVQPYLRVPKWEPWCRK